MENPIHIYRCRLGFKYSKYFIEVLLMATNKSEARQKFIANCLHNYNEIIQIDFKRYLNYMEHRTTPPDDFRDFHEENIDEFKQYMNNELDIHEDDIECLYATNFEIIDKYE